MIQVGPLTFKNPIVIASGPLTRRIELLERAEEHGAAAVSTKLTYSRVPLQGKFRTYSVPGRGLVGTWDQRLDESAGLKLIEAGRRKTSLVIIANFAGWDLDDWVKLAQKIEDAGAHALEANFVCPNISFSDLSGSSQVPKTGASIGQDPDLCKTIVKALKAAVKIPLICKIPSLELRNTAATALACQQAGADALAFNGGSPHRALPPLDIRGEGRPLIPLLRNVSLASCVGPWIKYSTFSVTAHLYQTARLPLIPSGGLTTHEDAITAILWGATLISVCTSVIHGGWKIVSALASGLDKYLAETATTYEALVGKSLKYLVPPSAMDYIEGYAWVDETKCNGCGVCLLPGHCMAVTLEDGKAKVNRLECVGCGVCASLCRKNAIRMREAG